MWLYAVIYLRMVHTHCLLERKFFGNPQAIFRDKISHLVATWSNPLNSVLCAQIPGTLPDTQCAGEPLDMQTLQPGAQADFSLSLQNQLAGAPGQDESNVNTASGHAFTWENCFNHNGLVRNGCGGYVWVSPQLLTSFALAYTLHSKTFSITILIWSPNIEHVYFKSSRFNPPVCSQKPDHLLSPASPYQRQPTPPVVIPSQRERRYTLITGLQTIWNCGGEEQQNLADINSPVKSQVLPTTVQPIRVLPKFDHYLDNSLPLTPSKDMLLVHTVQHTQPPATQLEAEIVEDDYPLSTGTSQSC